MKKSSVWCMIMMICARRITSLRSLSLGAIFVLVLLIRFLSVNNSLDHVRVSHSISFEEFLPDRRLSFSNTDEFGLKSASSIPCKLYQLGPEKQAAKAKVPLNQCKRVQPVPGSCDVAEKLFHSKPTASCHFQSSVEFCKIKETLHGTAVECSKKQCNFSLAAATVNIHSGQLQWRRFRSTRGLESWISDLLATSKSKRHYGFCFIGCIDGIDLVENEDISEDDLDVLQILLLPPNMPPHAYQNITHSRLHINFNLIFIDSVSRQHFFRSLPSTVKLFEDLSFSNTSRISLLDFELMQAVRSRTFETLQTLFSGEIDPHVKPFGTLEMPSVPLKTEGLLKKLKEKGYDTLWLEDLCYLWEWGITKDLLVHNKSSTPQETWKSLQRALRVASIDSLDVTYAMCKVLSENGVPDHFHGPEAVCFNGKHQHEYLLDYLLLYQENMARSGQPFFTFLETNVGHDDTGRRVQTLDHSLRHYLEHIVKQENTLTVVLSDHGNAYGSFIRQSMEGQMEVFHPHLFMLIPDKVAKLLGQSAMDALRTNQQRLISHLDLHYMLQSLASDFKNKVSEKHREYNITSQGLLQPVSFSRSCNHIPLIMPNLCICENFDMPVESDDYYALFAHLALGKFNNEIQRQFQKQSVMSHTKLARGYGHCQHLHLAAFTNVRKSFHQNTLSIKMDILVPGGQSPYLADIDPDLGTPDISALTGHAEIFFVAMKVRLTGIESSSSGSIILETTDRLTPFGIYSQCADSTVELKLCVCDLNRTGDSLLDGQLYQTDEQLGGYNLFMDTKVFEMEQSQGCLMLIVRKNDNGGLFFVTNVCERKLFEVDFILQTVEMIVSDAMPRQVTVFPGQEILLCMAVKNAPKARWNWSFTLQHKQEDLYS